MLGEPYICITATICSEPTLSSEWVVALIFWWLNSSNHACLWRDWREFRCAALKKWSILFSSLTCFCLLRVVKTAEHSIAYTFVQSVCVALLRLLCRPSIETAVFSLLSWIGVFVLGILVLLKVQPRSCRLQMLSKSLNLWRMRR